MRRRTDIERPVQTILGGAAFAAAMYGWFTYGAALLYAIAE